MDETLTAVAITSAEVIGEAGSEARRTVQVGGRAVAVAVLVMSATVLWFTAHTVLNRLAHAFNGNTTHDSKLTQLVSGEATFEVTSRKTG